MIKLQKKEMNLTFEYRIRQAQPLRFTLHIRCCQEEPKRGKPSHSGSNAMCSLLISILIKNRVSHTVGEEDLELVRSEPRQFMALY